MDYDELGIVSDIYFDDEVIRKMRLKPQTVIADKVPIEMRVEKVATPSKFFFHLAESHNKLKGLEKQMNEFYRKFYRTIRSPNDDDDMIYPFEFYGMYSRPKHRWVRVFKDVHHDDKNGFEVVLVDYAEREFVYSEEQLRYLPHKFTTLHAQGYQGQLKLADGMRNAVWTEGENGYFREKVLHRPLTVTPTLVTLGVFRDHPYIPMYSISINQDASNEGLPDLLDGIPWFNIEPMPTQKALIEVTRDFSNLWSKRCKQ